MPKSSRKEKGKGKANGKGKAKERQRKSKIKENDCGENMFDANHIQGGPLAGKARQVTYELRGSS